LILVTGGAGFIGSNIVEALVRGGRRIRILDDFSSGARENLPVGNGAVEVTEGDIRNLDLVRNAMKGVEAVIHLAARPSVPRSIEDPVGSQEVNARGTLHVLMAASEAGVRRVVYAASSSAYGDSPTLPKRESMPPAPKSPYAVDKLTGEFLCQVWQATKGLETVSLRFFNVFGPRQRPDSPYAAAVPRFIARIAEDLPPLVYGDGEQSRDFTYVENVVHATLLALTAKGAPGRVINVGCGQRITLNALIAELGRIFGREVAIDYAPAREGDVKHSLADITLAREVLGYEPRVGLEEGLTRTVDWYQAIERTLP
jgi:nucleoside-diphosphate-sugar epimerase